jgi:molybdopterin synthase catalytic subunit
MSTSLHLVDGPIPAELVSRKISEYEPETSAGALAFFIGRVRDDRVDDQVVTAIEYSAYDAMVDPVIEDIGTQLRLEFPDLRLLDIFHSTGQVRCGETSLLVMVSSGHRKQSFAALEKCVELIKEKLPVWKKEMFSDGSSRWIK